jgi:hypothetical protein
MPSLLPPEDLAAEPDVNAVEVANPQLDEPLPMPVSPSPPVIRSPSAKTAPPAAPATTPIAAKSAAPAALPSFDCGKARTRGEIAACRNQDLAGLDRQQTLFYSQSWLRAGAAKRVQLQQTRIRFIARRDSCRSVACARDAYLARMREVSAIMIAPGKPPN